MNYKILGMGGAVAVAAAVGFYVTQGGKNAAPIKVGILHSKTGTMAISETTVIDAEKFAIEEINAAGGINGRKIEVVEFDGKSDWGVFATGAEQLITQDKVVTVFGCWTSASRRTVKPIFEKYNHLLFYPVQYYTNPEKSAKLSHTIIPCTDRFYHFRC